MEWSTESIAKVICFIQERPFLFDVSSAELARKFDARNFCKKLVQVSSASFLTVCHHHKWVCGCSGCRLADRGHTVVGVDCSPLGLESFFRDHSLEFTTEPISELNGFLYKVRVSRAMLLNTEVNEVWKIVSGVVRTVGFCIQLFPSVLYWKSNLLDNLAKIHTDSITACSCSFAWLRHLSCISCAFSVRDVVLMIYDGVEQVWPQDVLATGLFGHVLE